MAEGKAFQHPLIERYASEEMIELFSPRRRCLIYRDLWIALAEAQRELGLPITEEQIEEMRRHREEIDFDLLAEKERELRHDVMAHIHVFGSQCPKAKPIIHLGATSAFVTDNADLIQMRDGLSILKRRLLSVIAALRDFAIKYKETPILGYTHLQPAQPTTLGKRACLWLQDFVMDYRELRSRIEGLKFRGVKGTTGTQDSFLKLFDGDERKVEELDRLVTRKMGFQESFTVTGQTYPRKVDAQIASTLAGIAASAHKFSNDVRLLQHMREVEEPFEERQVGSSAMPYKRNPVRSERIAALSRYLITLAQNAYLTAANQWLERTLDDSANRRIVIPEMFLTADAILILCLNVARGLRVYPQVIRRHIERELPFMATESILMESVKRGGDRQELHERLRKHSMEAAMRMREGKEGDLLERIASDEAFPLSREEIEGILRPEAFVGRAPSQVERFIKEEVDPILRENEELIEREADLRV